MNSGLAIRVENLGKRYLIGHKSARRSTTLRESLGQGLGTLRRSLGSMSRGQPLLAGDVVEEFWALKDLDFNVAQGDVVGIVGRNGAGKSTLLKLLSRITEPSRGRIEIRGRVASLLEVGTGFHAELSGRENIFLNGAILGMTRAEVRKKFDEIVDFADVERFLDTPVKRYSSGMYVRLAFAVAAHLEPEILIVDEVLAVGDAEFQRKCMGKMKDVAGHGRTVLFVSHNMTAIQSLCRTGILIKEGKLHSAGPINEVVNDYVTLGAVPGRERPLHELSRSGEGGVRFEAMEFVDEHGSPVPGPTTGKPVTVSLSLSGITFEPRPGRIGIAFQSLAGITLFLCASDTSLLDPLRVAAGASFLCHIPKFPLDPGAYGVVLFLERNGVVEDWLQEPAVVNVGHGLFHSGNRNAPSGHEGKLVLVEHSWASTPVRKELSAESACEVPYGANYKQAGEE